jgi:ribonuclease E
MNSKILINAVDPEEIRIAKVLDGKLEEFHIESAAREITHGNIYKGIISRIEPGLQSVFVDYGTERNGFLQKQEIHSDYYQDNHSGDKSIKSIVRKGQELLVQVTKDPIMKKGAMLTTFISLPGRYIVLMPGSKSKGISRKIEDDEERKRLKEIVEKLKLPDGFGLIVRTAGIGATKAMLDKDLRYLMRLWKNINAKGVKEEAPALLYKERSLVLRSIRDYLTTDVKEVLIDEASVHHEVKEFMKLISPKQGRIVKLYKGPKPIFTKYQLEEQIASIYEKRVPLKSGGSIVIDQTEALVAIDVNSGKAIHKKSIEQTAYLANTEAAEEIARQLRLRDLGGLIVIDFIDMKDNKHKLEVEKALRNGVKIDKARTKVGRISKFGLVEMSRQRIRPSIEFGAFVPCSHCQGKGLTPSTETLGLSFMRRLQLETLKEGVKTVRAVCHSDIADYLLNHKRRDILDLENRRDLHIRIQGDSDKLPKESEIICEFE